jgi:DNA-directed RNA polymerase subunit F
MTNKKEVAQKIWDTYCEGYSEALMTPVESFSTYLDKDSRKIIASVLREVVSQLQYQSFHHTEAFMQLDADDILELCEELEVL